MGCCWCFLSWLKIAEGIHHLIRQKLKIIIHHHKLTGIRRMCEIGKHEKTCINEANSTQHFAPKWQSVKATQFYKFFPPDISV